jgi:hypothetical protein
MSDAMQRALALARQTLELGLAAGSVLFVLAVVAVVVSRIGHPFELEKMEGGSVDHVLRLVEGQPLYPAPGVDFVAFAYTPLYYWAGALLAPWTGAGFVPLRAISVAAAAGVCALIFVLVRRETRSAFAGLLALGLFAATYPLSDAWLDLARVDSLYLFFLLAAVLLVRLSSDPLPRLAAGLAVALAFHTKQTALVISLPLALYCLAERWRTGLVFVAASYGAIGAATLALTAASDGWYRYYVFTLQAKALIVPAMIAAYWTTDLWAALPVAVLLAAFYLLGLAFEPGRRSGWLWLCAAAGFVGGTWPSRIAFGQHVNALLPAHAMLAILFGLGWKRAAELARRAGPHAEWLGAFLALACALQLATRVYDPRRFVPSPADRAAGESFVARMRAVEGDVLLASHGFLPRLAGKPSFANGVGVSDVMLRDAGSPAQIAFTEAMRTALREQRFGAVILDTRWWFQEELEAHYEESEPVFTEPNVFYPVSGSRTRPERVYVPRRPPLGAEGAAPQDTSAAGDAGAR